MFGLVMIFYCTPGYVLSDPVRHISAPIFSRNLNGLSTYANFDSEVENCFSPHHLNTSFLKNITDSDPREMLKSFQYQGCKGIPTASNDQMRMLNCCDDLKTETSLELEKPSFGLYGQVCSNLNILGLAQKICKELNRNQSTHQAAIKSLLSSKDFSLILGQISYMELHKAFVSIIMQHIWITISQVEIELGWNILKDDDGRAEPVDRMGDCRF